MANLNDVLSQLGGTPRNTLSSVAAELGAGQLTDGVRGLSTQVDLLRSLFQTQTTTTRENTDALLRNTQLASSSGNGALNTAANVARTASSVLGGGGLLSPLFSGLLKLFGGGSKPADPPALTNFALPDAVTLDGMIQNNGTSALATTQYGQNGLPRPVAPKAAAPAQNVTVNINAIDSRSFLDHSDDIARAVRQAMLDSHSLNDVIAEI